MTRAEQERQQAIEEAQRAERMSRCRVIFVCPTCSTRTSAFLAPGENTMRTCRSIYGPWKLGCGHYQGFLPADEICGQVLDVFSDERPQ